jgi:hypothetical protein
VTAPGADGVRLGRVSRRPDRERPGREWPDERGRSEAMATDAEGTGPSFERDIKPLFRESDRDSMLESFDLWSYDDVKANADAIRGRVEDGSMPCDEAWPEERVQAFTTWMEAGTPP